uniref:Protein RodZ, contains Xre-like HTH and DUF4115 domains n=1 Tax=Candidatus Kentrum sp. DK TaxID=2126562 RepID=A0A450SDY9_9GAMM|nr:MAG: protein RodZ, contains Xre-like HTH and DUF4115 domains [Candidatus Kentron sp. DK]
MTNLPPNPPTKSGNGEKKGPGRQLREARRSYNLTVEDVAAYLRLHPATVHNLEEDNYAHLPGPTFVRGYLRSYARSLDMDPEPILDGFGERYTERPVPIQGIVEHSRMRGDHIVVRISTYFIVFVLIALLFSWWQNQVSFGDAIVEEEIITLSDGMNAGISFGEETQMPPSLFTGPETNRVPDAWDDKDHATGTEAAEVAIAPSRSEKAPKPNPIESVTPAITGDASVTAPLPGDIGDTGEPATEPPEEKAKIPLDAPKVGHLTLHLRGDSWMGIYDGNGKRLYYGTGLAGETYKFQGITPFHVTLGYARGVDVVYNGKPFDLWPHIRRKRAEFSLD